MPALVLMIVLTGADERALSPGRPEGIPAPASDTPEDTDATPETPPETPPEQNPGNSDAAPEETPDGGDGPPEQTPGSGDGSAAEQPDDTEPPDSDTPGQTPEDAAPETPPEQTPGNGDGPPEESPGNGSPAEQPDETEPPDSDTPGETPEDAAPETPPEQTPGNGDEPPVQPPAEQPNTPGTPGSDTTPEQPSDPRPDQAAPPAPDGPRTPPSDTEGQDGGEGTNGDRDPDGGASTPPLVGSTGSAPLTGGSSSPIQGSGLREDAEQNVASGPTSEGEDPDGTTPPRDAANVWDHLAAVPVSSTRGSTVERDRSPGTAGDDDVVARGGSESSAEQDSSVEPDRPVDDDPGALAAGSDTDQGDESSGPLFASQAFAPPEDAEGVAVWLLALSLLAFVVLTAAVVVQRGRLAEAVAGFVPVGRSSTPKKAESRPDNLRSRFSPGSGGTISPPSAGSASTALRRPAPAESAPPLAPPSTLPDARQEAPSPAPAPREAEPSAASDTPPSPPSGAVADLTARIAEELQVDPTTLYAAAAAVERRQTRTLGLDRATAAAARSESRLASVSLCLMPAGAGAALVALGDKTTLPAVLLSGVVIVLAAALTFRGFRWVRRLPDTQRRVPGGSARSLDDDADRLDGSLATVDGAVLYAAAGQDGLEALRLAAPDDPTHPVRNALTQPGGAQPPVTEIERVLVSLTRTLGRTSNSADAATLLDWASERLHATHEADLRERVLLVRVRAVGPFLLCYLPASALLLTPLLL